MAYITPGLVVVAIVSSLVFYGLKTAGNFDHGKAASWTEDILMSMSQAAENSALDHKGRYPLLESELAAYLDHNDYCGAIVSGHNIMCNLAAEGYTITAKPVLTGRNQ